MEELGSYMVLLIKMLISIIIWTAVTITAVRGEIFTWIKDRVLWIAPKRLEDWIATLMYCSQCAGFWVGTLGAVFIYPEWIPLSIPSGIAEEIVRAILNGFTISLSATITDRMIYGKYLSITNDESDQEEAKGS